MHFVKHTPKFALDMMRREAPTPERAREREIEDRPDREDEAPIVVSEDDALISKKRKAAAAKLESVSPEVPEDRFRERPRAVAVGLSAAPASDEPEADQGGRIVFNKQAKGVRRTAKSSGGPRAAKLTNQKLLSFDDE